MCICLLVCEICACAGFWSCRSAWQGRHKGVYEESRPCLARPWDRHPSCVLRQSQARRGAKLSFFLGMLWNGGTWIFQSFQAQCATACGGTVSASWFHHTFWECCWAEEFGMNNPIMPHQLLHAGKLWVHRISVVVAWNALGLRCVVTSILSSLMRLCLHGKKSHVHCFAIIRWNIWNRGTWRFLNLPSSLMR